MARPTTITMRSPKPRGVASAAASSSAGPSSNRLDEIAASRSPPARVERLRGTELDPPLVRAVIDLTRRNMREFVGGAWSKEQKQEELCDAEMRHIAVRAGNNALLGFAAWRLQVEEGVPVGYLYELQLEEFARGMRLGSELIAEVEAAARAERARGLMLTVHTRNAAARRFYTQPGGAGFEVSPLSPAECAPPFAAQACDYEILQKLWDDDARRVLVKKGSMARKANYLDAMDNGSLRIRLVMKGGGSRKSSKVDEEADPMTGPRTKAPARR
jgi:ribosomal protein S18 acetylase RimI-like enzyme